MTTRRVYIFCKNRNEAIMVAAIHGISHWWPLHHANDIRGVTRPVVYRTACRRENSHRGAALGQALEACEATIIDIECP